MSRLIILGATGTIGRATVAAALAAGHDVLAPVRNLDDALPAPTHQRQCDVTAPGALADQLSGDGPCDAVISCLASRTGSPRDAWAIDHDAHVTVLDAVRAAGIPRFVLLSAICVQKPKLAFQHAKLAFEDKLGAADLDWTIVRPTAYFKSLSGQIARLQQGKPFLLFGDGRLTACTPISDRDLGRYLVQCATDPGAARRILPIGGPGPALTPRAQGEMLFDLMDCTPEFRHVPVALMDAIIGGLSLAGRVSPGLRDKAELARIGRYYATESMLVWDAAQGKYDAAATPSFGTDTLRDHYAAVLRGTAQVDLGAHSVF